ncbi:MAG TPA: 2,3-bisphosphoglycerate-independent phosphoglycerate mutase [Spirochaetia bacterium]|nr:MAG: phosphoglycerate mutase (2,3-diphosphoglycerate-independent) [Spirochaetes bacterium GWB1_36_13]HCL55838.1 2,3-bisphosphoglycerate-independent phosphoglycerate mutase [Spirochaetia bacterium]
MKQKAALIILDGFGYREESYGNAIAQAEMKTYQKLWKNYPHTTLGASGLAVGLPDGQMGNSEVGHLNIGAGRIVYQTYTRIDKAIEEKSFFHNPVFINAVQHALDHQSSLHLIGLLSDGGVHSHIRHFYALLELAKSKGIKKVFIHALLDGRDVPPSSGKKYIQEFEKETLKIGIGKIATVIGRYYGMDRDNRWERVEKAYQAMVDGEGRFVLSAVEAVDEAFKKGETDEFVSPCVIIENGKPVGKIEDKDSVLFMNFRPDRAREISQALGLKDFTGFERKTFPEIHYCTMAEYDASFPFPVAYRPENMENILSKVLSENHFSQLRTAETEKYAHVTFFFNGQIESPFPKEERILIPSPKVPTYDLQPEMSAYEVTESLLKKIDEDIYDVIIVNYANPDMVGHTGKMDAAVAALKTVDGCLLKSVEKFLSKGIPVLITADHGNADEMYDKDGNPMTAHTTNRVPFILVSDNKNILLRNDGVLADIAPTLLEILKIEKPVEMTGTSLIKR